VCPRLHWPPALGADTQIDEPGPQIVAEGQGPPAMRRAASRRSSAAVHLRLVAAYPGE
jgi:hypothetical protein